MAPLLVFSFTYTLVLALHVGFLYSFTAAEERCLAVDLSLVKVIVAVLEDD